MATTPIPIVPNPVDSPNPLLSQLRRNSLSLNQQAKQPEPAPLPPPQAQADTSAFPSQQPAIKAPRGTVPGEQAERTRLLTEGAPSSHIASKVEGLMPNHPTAGKILGGIAQGAGQVGDTLLSAIAPGLASRIPGTEAHHETLVNRENKLVGDMTKQGLEQAQEQEAQARVPLIGAQTHEAEARAHTLENPNEKDQMEWAVDPNFTGPNGEPVLYNKASGEFKVGDQPVGIKRFQPPAQEKNLQQVTTLGPDGKPHTYGVDTSGNKVVDYGVHYERPMTVNVGAGEKEFEYSDKQLAGLSKPIAELQMRMGRLKDTLAAGTPQADALVAPEMLTIMAGGQGSGLRMNEAEIARIVGGRSHWENLKASMQKWSADPATANSITPDQRRQVHALINAVDQKLQRKQQFINKAGDDLLNAKTPQEQHRIVMEARKGLAAIDAEPGGGNASSEGGVTPPPGAKIIKFEDVK